MNLPIKDVKFIAAEQINGTKDLIVLRITIRADDGREADALVRLDVQCYVDTNSEGDLLELMARNGPLPRQFGDAAPDALKVEQGSP